MLSSNLMLYADLSCWEMMVHQNEWKCGPGTRRHSAAYQHLSKCQTLQLLLITFQYHIQSIMLGTRLNHRKYKQHHNHHHHHHRDGLISPELLIPPYPNCSPSPPSADASAGSAWITNANPSPPCTAQLSCSNVAKSAST